MNERLELSDAAIETMLVRRARRADPGDLADVALDAVRRTRARSARPWDGLARWPRLDTGSPRWVWIAVAAMLAIALVGGLLAAGASRLHQRQYPIVTSGPELNWLSRQGAVSADELWTVAAGESPSRDGGSVAGMAASPGTVLWHYIGGTWQSPISPPPLGDEAVGDLALAPDGAVWVSSGTTVAVYRDGSWTRAWSAPSGTALRGLVAAPDGTVWVGQDRELVGLRQEGDRYVSRSLQCPWIFSRLAVTTDGTIYAGSFSYSDGPGGLARSDGVTCEFVDAVGDGKVHEVSELSAGPAGSLLAIVFDGLGAVCPCRAWTVIVRDGRWSTISGPTVDAGVDVGQIMDRGGHPWRIAGGALQRYAGGIWRTVAPSALALAMAPDGVLWYETDRGLERIQTDEVGG